MNIEYTKNFIKGKIAENIFELMFRECNKFTVLKFGYENTVPELAQYQHLAHIKSVLENIRNAPDFVLISQDKTEIYLVEVKYRTNINPQELKEFAEQSLKTWNPLWLFIASPKGFFFSPCSYVIKGEGNISPIQEKWVSNEMQKAFLEVLNYFEKPKTI
jgi:hypothetical protein